MVSRLEILLYTDLSPSIQSLALYVSDIRIHPDKSPIARKETKGPNPGFATPPSPDSAALHPGYPMPTL